MADAKITALTALTTPSLDDLLAIVDDPAGSAITKKITLANLFTFRVPRIVIAAADESIANDTIQDDDELLLTVDANAVYHLEGLLLVTTGVSDVPDAKFGFTFPALATVTVLRHSMIAAAVATTELSWAARYQSATPTTALSFGAISTASIAVSPCFFTGVVRVGANAGTLQLQWAQNTSTGGTPTVRKADSYLALTRVS